MRRVVTVLAGDKGEQPLYSGQIAIEVAEGRIYIGRGGSPVELVGSNPPPGCHAVKGLYVTADGKLMVEYDSE